MKIAAFGFRSIPPINGSAGADKFAMELYSRIAAKGIKVVAYNRIYDTQTITPDIKIPGITLKYLKTTEKSGFDTLLHSFKCTIDIIKDSSIDVVHIHNGGNSMWALPLRFFGKKVFISQDGVDWKRDKWSWYAKLFLMISSYITAYFPNQVIFDNIFAKELFENKFNSKYMFIPYGSEVKESKSTGNILKQLSLEPNNYYLFVGRFIPDKGLHYLIPAFEKINTNKKLVMIGGSPNKSEYEIKITSTKDERIIFPGYIYGDDTNYLIKNAYAYIQPSDVEGLSPVILTVLGLGTPLICSDIPENIYIVKDMAKTFRKSDINSLKEALEYAENNIEKMQENAQKALAHVNENYSWEKVTEEHMNLFNKN